MQRGEDPDWPSAYSTTLVLVSDDPFHWERADVAGEIAAHAAEVIVDDTDGSTWISHCGWGQGGVYLAPLSWSSP
jgi:hypothetical protein